MGLGLDFYCAHYNNGPGEPGGLQSPPPYASLGLDKPCGGVEQSQVQIDVIAGDVLELGIQVAEKQRIKASYLAVAAEERVIAGVHPEPQAQNVAPFIREGSHISALTWLGSARWQNPPSPKSVP